ncbi:right-handed parallel beta-helix repeat-containing protein [Allorhizocola rhizosphaerae]|uniref:right-handed parallel beta-helix repeat-containing protein n=1 Tax=Allorhizocola rhizosphaerae TaxID=1872709 RepID=UPI000E3C007B|nr:right-handed parallel beta-helix repeat-containing protein [Allorhizocola rhizosphaerae]
MRRLATAVTSIIVSLIVPVSVLTPVPATATATANDTAERTPGGWYAQLPTSMQVCSGNGWQGGPVTAPPGAITVPAGDNTGFPFGQANQTFWFAPGEHTLGTGEFSQITPGSGSTYLGAPGAVVDGKNTNRYAFTGTASNVRIAFLEVRNFGRGLDNNNEGVINHDSGTGWTMEHLYAHHNDGAAVFLGSGNTIRHSCLKDNGQYGISMYKDQIEGGSAITNIVLHNNEIVGNNQDDWESLIEGCGCTGGVKFWDVKGAVVTQNYVHDNLSVGLWADTNDIDFLFDSNWIEHNDSIGIWYEVSYNATVSRNVFKRNAWVSGNENLGSPAPAIYLSESGGDARLPHSTSGSPNLNIHNNLFEDNFSGVSIYENANRFCNSNGNTSKTYCTPFVSPTIIAPPYDFDYLDPISATHPCYTSIASEPYRTDCRWHSKDIKVYENEFRFSEANVPCAGDFCGAQALIATGADNLPWMPYTVAEVQDDVMFNNGNVFHDNAYFGNWKFATRWGDTVLWNAWRAAPYHQDAGSTFDGQTGPAPSSNLLDADTATLEGSIGQWHAWYNCTIERSASAAHAGAWGLQVNATGGSWGVELANWPGFDAGPGAKRLSLWARTGSGTIPTATLRVRWFDTNQQVIQTDDVPLTGLTTSWQEVIVNLTAPAATATVSVELVGTAQTGSSLHLDDVVLADQPGGQALSW